MKKFKKFWISIAVVLGILLLTNPSLSRFKEFNGKNGKRPYNFFVFSIFQDEGKSYVGVLGNFFISSHPPVPEEKQIVPKPKWIFSSFNECISANYNYQKKLDYYLHINKNDIENLYNNLTKAGYRLGSFNDFVSHMQDDDIRSNFYRNLTSAGYNLGNSDDFALRVKKQTNIPCY